MAWLRTAGSGGLGLPGEPACVHSTWCVQWWAGGWIRGFACGSEAPRRVPGRPRTWSGGVIVPRAPGGLGRGESSRGALGEAEQEEPPLAMRVETAQAATWEVPAMEQTTLAAVAARAKEEEDAVARRRASLTQPDPIAGDVIRPATPLAAATKDDATEMFLQGLFAAKRS